MATGCTFTVTDPHPPLPLLTLIAQAPICTFLIGRTPARISVRISFWEVGKPQLTWAAKQLTRQVLTRQAPPISTTKHPVFTISTTRKGPPARWTPLSESTSVLASQQISRPAIPRTPGGREKRSGHPRTLCSSSG